MLCTLVKVCVIIFVTITLSVPVQNYPKLKRSIPIIPNDKIGPLQIAKQYHSEITQTKHGDDADVELFPLDVYDPKYGYSNAEYFPSLSLNPTTRDADYFAELPPATEQTNLNLENKKVIKQHTSQPSKSVVPEIISRPVPIVNITQTLHPVVKSYFAFTLRGGKVYSYQFDLDTVEANKPLFISVAVEKMYCAQNDINDPDLPKLFIGGMNELLVQERNETIPCSNFDTSSNNFQSLEHVVDGYKSLIITNLGNWSQYSMSANLVVSLYYEVRRCEDCDQNGDFCCGKVSDPCGQFDNLNGLNDADTESYRCIPRKQLGIKGNTTSLLCDGHPNCGLRCNLDELTDHCVKDDEPNHEDENSDATCPGYYCRSAQQDRFLLTILLLVIFCLFIPFCIFLLFCSRKEIIQEIRAGGNGRCPVALEIFFCPFSINPDADHSQNPSSARTRRRRGNPRRAGGIRRTAEVNSIQSQISGEDNFSFFDDLPPSYSECCNNKVTYPNPPKVFAPETPPSLPSSRASTSTQVPMPAQNPVQLQVLTLVHQCNVRRPQTLALKQPETKVVKAKKAESNHVSATDSESECRVQSSVVDSLPIVSNDVSPNTGDESVIVTPLRNELTE